MAGGLLAWKTVSGLREVRFLDPWERAASQPIAFETRDGLLDLTELQGKIVLIDVWASWCAPCIQMIPNLVELQNEYREELQVIGLNVDINDWEDLESFLEEHSMTYTVAMLGPGQSVALETSRVLAEDTRQGAAAAQEVPEVGRAVERRYAGRLAEFVECHQSRLQVAPRLL